MSINDLMNFGADHKEGCPCMACSITRDHKLRTELAEAHDDCIRLQQEINCLRMEPCQLPACAKARKETTDLTKTIENRGYAFQKTINDVLLANDALQARLDAAREEIARLRNALEKIADENYSSPSGIVYDAKQALSAATSANAKVMAIELNRRHAMIGNLMKALKTIASSAPCKKGHESFNTPGQPCDQRIANDALATQKASLSCCGHKSDCAVHNEPAYPNGPCDCNDSAKPACNCVVDISDGPCCCSEAKPAEGGE